MGKKERAKDRKNDLDYINVQISRSLKKEFKAKLASEGKIMKDVICELVEKYVKSDK